MKKLLLSVAVAGLFSISAQAALVHEHHKFAASELKSVADELTKEIKDGVIAKAEQDEAYELIGSLEVCRPIVEKAAQVRAAHHKAGKVIEKNATAAFEKVKASVEDLNDLIADLKMTVAQDPSTLKLIGELRMCEPVMKNIAALREHQHNEANKKTEETSAEKPAEQPAVKK